MLESWKIYRSGEFGAESLPCPELKGDFMRYSKNSVRRAMMFALTSIGLLGVSACPSWLQVASCAAADIDSVAAPSFTALKTANSLDLPTVNPFQAELSGGSDGLASEFDPTWSKLIYSTYLGGTRYDYAKGIAVDSQGSVYVRGEAGSVDFPEAEALGSVVPEAKEAVPALRAELKDQEWSVRSAAAEALGQIGPEAKKTVPALRAELRDQDVNIRRAAAKALWEIGPAAKEAVP